MQDEILAKLDVLIAGQQRMIALLERAGESRSSVEIGSTSLGVKVKSYADGRTQEAGREALDEFIRSRDGLRNAGDTAAFEKTAKALSR